jgi:hypothetical protein
MTAWPPRPVLYEVNTAVWLDELSRAAGRRLTLADLTAAHWDAVTPHGVDAVWLMGVWERSPAGLAIANANDELQRGFRAALPDLRPEDVIGSPYCVRRYVVDAAFGGPDGLAAARAALARHGVRLILDYVPNHVAPDHPWVTERPDVFVTGSQRDLDSDPSGWLDVGGTVLAHGRDPYFPPWPDVVQLNAFSATLRAATVATLTTIADQCDGIRCDMAMLMTNQVFARTWGERAGPEPEQDFWPETIGALRAHHADALLIAEAYWDFEWALQQQGFDYCYDKTLYDRMIATDPAAVHEHLRADITYQAKLLRFLENHDEPRVAERMSREAEQAAAVGIATLPGATLWHEGQFEGRRARPPVFLARRPDEPLDHDLAGWYRNLLARIADQRVREGEWRLLEVTGWPDNQTCRNLLAWAWAGENRFVVVINFSDRAAQGRVALGFADLADRGWNLVDVVTKQAFRRDGTELADSGLFVDLGPWQHHLLALT